MVVGKRHKIFGSEIKCFFTHTANSMNIMLLQIPTGTTGRGSGRCSVYREFTLWLRKNELRKSTVFIVTK